MNEGFNKAINILEGTANGSSREQIAKFSRCSEITVWSYQKMFGMS